MDYLSRESAPFSADLWKKVDDAVVNTASRVLIGRRFLNIFGPLGSGIQSINLDNFDETKSIEEETIDGISRIKNREYKEIPLIYSDFTLPWRDIESSEKLGYPVDLSAATFAAEACAQKEDKLIFLGSESAGYEGIFNAKGTNKIKKNDWKSGENPFTDIASAVEILTEQGIYGKLALIVSPDLYLQMQRIQPGTGVLESDRISKLLHGNIFTSPILGKNKAALLCTEPNYIDIVIGQDIVTAYLELRDLNHVLRILETVLLRIKNRKAIVVFE
ncbi:family 1 encapsulin nanocompartment shell protein [Clostridium luticellarii]|jgi:uncharacterized linocin/CFP29 family protein|uniref:family 1 encapsulin nanocompartment shell protein n=1 Tax=Clostridium luticellarii TaxID=1691940 RepID=UPI0023553772|nr:family 1 encapsulin nanocompartment shell protein [Clostridium luticellarii]MCI1944931.1 bacteriocin family protein [Clostridium luticellarii]MCI1968393.1 bacteriocin family protein [Clostridium luticellarii]